MHGGDVVEAGGHEERDTFFLKIVFTIQQAGGEAIDASIHFAIGIALVALDECDPVVVIRELGKGILGHNIYLL